MEDIMDAQKMDAVARACADGVATAILSHLAGRDLGLPDPGPAEAPMPVAVGQ